MAEQIRVILTILSLADELLTQNLDFMTPENAIKILSNPLRVAVLQWLKQPEVAFADYQQLYDFSEYGVCASLIQKKAGLSQPATSLLLKSLSDGSLVTPVKIGKWTYYKSNNKNIREMSAQVIEYVNNI